jgi:hypothetical protein
MEGARRTGLSALCAKAWRRLGAWGRAECARLRGGGFSRPADGMVDGILA